MSSSKITKHDLDSDVLSGIATEEFVEEKVSSIPTPDVSGQINEHNNDVNAHTGMFAPMYSYGTTDLEAGVSPLATGTLHFVHE